MWKCLNWNTYILTRLLLPICKWVYFILFLVSDYRKIFLQFIFRPRSIETRRQELSVYQFEELLQNKCFIEWKLFYISYLEWGWTAGIVIARHMIGQDFLAISSSFYFFLVQHINWKSQNFTYRDGQYFYLPYLFMT